MHKALFFAAFAVAVAQAEINLGITNLPVETRIDHLLDDQQFMAQANKGWMAYCEGDILLTEAALLAAEADAIVRNDQAFHSAIQGVIYLFDGIEA